MGPAKPEHGGLHLSATRVDTFKKCQRKWAFEYIARIPYKPSPWLAFGTLFHAHAERYFGTGQLPDLGILSRDIKTLTEDETAARLFLTSLKHWPKYRPNYFEVERAFQTQVPGGLFTGSVDLVLLTEKIIGDHKTTSDLKWAPDVGTLITWPQPVCYSYHTARELGWKENRCRWVYTEKVTGRTQVVHTEQPVPFSYWEDEWLGTYLPLTTEMAALHAAKANPLNLSGASDTDYCDAYGGCPFRELCPTYTAKRDSALYGGFDEEDENMNGKDNELDALLGTVSKAPEQEIGNIATSEPEADLDSLFNPPARTNVPQANSGAPPLVDATATAETQAQAETEAATKPKKGKVSKGNKRAVHIPEIVFDAQTGETDEERQTREAQETRAKTKAFLSASPPVSAPVAQEVVPVPQVQIPQALFECLQMFVTIYLEGIDTLGPSAAVASAAVRELQKSYQGNDLLVRSCEIIASLRKAFATGT